MKRAFLLVLVLSSVIIPQSAGNSGLSFLKIGFGARNIAMGDIGVVSSNDLTSLNYNPAILAGYTSPEIIFTHNEWLQDVRSEVFGGSVRFLGLPLAFGVNTTRVPDIEVRTRPGDAESKFTAQFFSGSASTGFYLLDNLSIGATAKYIYEGMFSDDANGWGFDFGAFYTTSIEGLSIGAAVRNLGSMNQLRFEETKLPSDFSFGAQYFFALNNINSEVKVGTAYQKYTDSDDSHINIGTEFYYDKLLALRAGYQTGYESKGFSAGVGLTWSKLFFDYGFVPFKYNLGTTHIISIKLKF